MELLRVEGRGRRRDGMGWDVQKFLEEGELRK